MKKFVIRLSLHIDKINKNKIHSYNIIKVIFSSHNESTKVVHARNWETVATISKMKVGKFVDFFIIATYDIQGSKEILIY